MPRQYLILLMALILVGALNPVAVAQEEPPPAVESLASETISTELPALAEADTSSSGLAPPLGIIPSNHQDSGHLGRVTSAVIPADGLLTVGLGGKTYSTVYQIDGFLERVNQKDLFLSVEAVPWPWLQASAQVPFRTWADGKGWIPESGSGLGDGNWQLTAGRSVLGKSISGAIFGGGNLPIGAEGLTEGTYSPLVGTAITWRFWRDRQAPEMRLHLNFAYRWNKAETDGYGLSEEFFEPWFPRYPEAGSQNSNNDQTTFGAALEFRKGTTSIWLDYTRDRYIGYDNIAGSEQFSGLGAGVRWGVMEGWAIHAEYLVSLAKDDLNSDWDPAYPDLTMEFAVSKQFSIGGRDQDGDGVADRHDHCPLLAEDQDNWQDEDGCPDLDNDFDGIPDALDAAPNTPEDFDGWQDEDGMPEPDNDQDGIFDWLDECPDEAEDIDGYRDEDGCPEEFADRDQDGIEDSRDGCPDQPEDLDGFEDEDGCPDPDNDLDGIKDEDDACPDEAEDYNGIDDDDGCPEKQPEQEPEQEIAPEKTSEPKPEERPQRPPRKKAGDPPVKKR